MTLISFFIFCSTAPSTLFTQKGMFQTAIGVRVVVVFMLSCCCVCALSMLNY